VDEDFAASPAVGAAASAADSAAAGAGDGVGAGAGAGAAAGAAGAAGAAAAAAAAGAVAVVAASTAPSAVCGACHDPWNAQAGELQTLIDLLLARALAGHRSARYPNCDQMKDAHAVESNSWLRTCPQDSVQ